MIFFKVVLDHNSGARIWYRNNQLHREDGPAFDLPNGYKAWCLNGDVYRIDQMDISGDPCLPKSKFK